MGKRNPTWAREELILALEFYMRHRGHPAGKDSDEVRELSSVLRELAIHEEAPGLSTFRNVNSVYMKLCNFLHIDPDHAGEGLRAVGRNDRRIWDEFADDPPRLRRLAGEIRLRAKCRAHG